MKILRERLRTSKGEIFGWVVDNFVSKDVCRELIDAAKPKLKPSTTLEPVVENYRTSSNTFLYYNRGIGAVDKVASLVTDIIDLPLVNCEGMQVVHYNSGEYYKPHHDYFHAETSYWEREMARGGQRIWTAFLYLNDVSEGGSTSFPNINVEVKPKAGRIVLWLNVLGKRLNTDSYHEAKPPIDCEKWGANIWVREGIFK